MRLLKLDERVQQMVIDGMLTTGHARALLAIEDPEVQFQTAVRVYNEKMSVRDVEKLVKNQDRKAPEKKQEDPQQQAVFHDMEERMKLALGTKVAINRKDCLLYISVVGAGHACCEAALACARLGLETAIFTVSVDSIALMPCNPVSYTHLQKILLHQWQQFLFLPLYLLLLSQYQVPYR